MKVTIALTFYTASEVQVSLPKGIQAIIKHLGVVDVVASNPAAPIDKNPS